MRKFNMNPLWLAALLPAMLIGGCRTVVGPSETEADRAELSRTPQRRLPVNLEMTGSAVGAGDRADPEVSDVDSTSSLVTEPVFSAD